MPEFLDITQPEGAGSRPGNDDLSALSWVHVELRRSLDAAQRALRRHLKEAEAARGSDLAAVDPSVLRSARSQFHQGAGALDLVGLPAAARLLRASEAAVQRMAARPAMADAAAVETLERASFALMDFLARQLARKPVSTLMLFPQYRAVQQLAAAERIHPADLWQLDWQWRDLPPDPTATSRSANDAARGAMETLVLALMRQRPGDDGRQALTEMSNLCADLGAGARETSFGGPRVAAFWQLAAAVFEAQANGLLASDVYVKRLASGILGQLRLRVRGQYQLPDRLAHDLLFFCAHAKAPSHDQPSPRLALLRQAWQLDDAPTADYETTSLGRFDPAVTTLARKRVALAKDSWSAVAGAEMHRLGGLPEQFQLVGDSLQRLLPDGQVLAQALQTAIGQTVASGQAPPPALAMEVATAILYVDASLEDAELDHPELAERVQRLARRIDDVRIGADPQPLDAWMEELYRRVSDRQTMGSVVAELRASLSEIEKQIDQYFRDPSQRDLLIPVPGQLSAMRGVLSVLGMDQASQAALHMRDDVEALAQTEVDPQRAVQTGTFDRLADNLGALSFLIDMLSVQPTLAKSLFRFDPETGSLSAVMGQRERVSAFAAFDDGVPRLPASRAPAAPTLASVAAATPSPVASQTAPAPAAGAASGLEDDAEMREIFIEEAREVIADARAALDRLADTPDNAGDLTAVRRAFHTLKGSSRMVGLREFGEAGWACEQLYNDRLASAPRMDGALRGFTHEALSYLADWAEVIAVSGRSGHNAADVAHAADALRLQGTRLPIASPSATSAAAEVAAPVAASSAPAAAEAAADADADADAELRFELPEALTAPPPFAQPPAATPTAVVDAAFDLDFDLQDPALEDADFDPSFAADTLQLRVPDLPSAADLDLRQPAPATSTAAPTEPAPGPAPDFDFDLDFDGIEEPTVAATPAAAGEELFELPLDAPAPVAELSALELPTLDLPHAELPSAEMIELDLADFDADFAPSEPAPQPAAQPVSSEAAAAAGGDEATDEFDDDEEQVKVIGPLRISIPLFNIYLNEADELSRRLCTELAEWALEHERHPVPESAVVLAHSLAGSSATVGYGDLSALARALEHALMRSRSQGPGRPGEAQLFGDTAEEMRRLLHQFAAGFLRVAAPELIERLTAHERVADGAPLPPAYLVDDEPLVEQAHEPAAAPAAAADAPPQPPPEPVAVDAIDPELFPIFEEEADELLPQLQSRLRDWHDRPAEGEAAMAAMRTLHTLKGGSRLAGAVRLGDLAHQLESAIEALTQRGGAQSPDIEPLLAMADAMSVSFDALRKPVPVQAPSPAPASVRTPAPVLTLVPERSAAPPPAAMPEPPADLAPIEPAGSRPEPVVEEPVTAGFDTAEATAPAAAEPVDAAPPAVTTAPDLPPTPVAAPARPAPLPIDWQRFVAAEADNPAQAAADRPAGPGAVVRVRAGLLDRLVNQAGEVSITRARIQTDLKLMQGSLGELTEALERMRRQLRDIEVQAETQISSRLEAAKAAQSFDPLEMDRFTRFQELTRFMAESVNDVATLQRSLQRTVQSTEDELAMQARLTRELQDDLLRTRMVEFESLSERLHRTVRQAAKETVKQVKLEIQGGAIEVDRGVLERMAGCFEHLLRNCVAHGIELPFERSSAGKDASGAITIAVAQAGNEVAVEFADDGRGLDLVRIRSRAIERGLLAPEAEPGDAELTQLIFQPGFSTAESVTELAGRGVGLDVVRAEVNAMGGRIETQSSVGHGTRFKLLLPLTTAVTQVVMLRCGNLQVAVPSTLVEIVRRTPSAEVEQAYADGHYGYGEERLPFFWLAALLQTGSRGEVAGRSQTVVVIRSASQRVALHVDEVVGNQEVVVKNVGPQLSRLPGLAGVTLLPSGSVALIYNPVALASVYGDAVHARVGLGPVAAQAQPVEAQPVHAPMVMVVDDSLTVRRVTQRLLVREGYRVVTAKDGLDALERLAEERPSVLLSDIEMPRMDGFDLVRNVRSDPTLAGLPVVMITSRIAQKHRDYAAELGVEHYLGKPYAEDELLAVVARYARAAAAAPV